MKKARYNMENQQVIINVLITSISAKVPLIKSLNKALLKLANQGKIYGSDFNLSSIARYFVDNFWEMPKLNNLSIEDFIKYCQVKRIICVIPTRDGELSYFARHKRLLSENGIQVMVSDLESVETCLDKLAFYQRLNILGFPAISTAANIDCIQSELYVVKERYGAGARSIGLSLSKSQAIEHASTLEDPIYQPYFEGIEYSVDLYLNKEGKAKGVVVRKRSLVVNGESQITETLRYPQLEMLSVRLAETLKLYGHIVMQIIVSSDGEFHIVECNSRFGGASTLSLEVGLDSFYWFLLESQGVELKEYPFLRTEKEKRLIRYAEDLILE